MATGISVSKPAQEDLPWEALKSHNLIPQEEIGHGAFGTVYKARGKIDGATYAIKKVSVGFFQKYHYRHNTDDQTWITNLSQEVTNLARLQSNFVVRYYDCWFDGPDAEAYNNMRTQTGDSTYEFSSTQPIDTVNYFYIKMGHCQSDLRKWLAARNLMTQQQTSLVFEQVLSGLEYIHSKRIVHRDIKPDNIMIKETDPSIEIQIGDFGLSTLVLQESEGNKITNTRKCGAEYYRSPEMANGEVYGVKTDVYSTGLVFLEMVNPLLNDSERRKSAFIKIRDGTYVFQSEVIKNFPKEIDLIKKMTKVDKGERVEAKEALEYWRKLGDVSNHLNSSVGSQSLNSEVKRPGPSSQFQSANPTLNPVEAQEDLEYWRKFGDVTNNLNSSVGSQSLNSEVEIPGPSSPDEIDHFGEIIRQNLVELCDGTSVNGTLLAYLFQENIINGPLMEEIEKTPGNQRKAMKLYQHIIKFKSTEVDKSLVIRALDRSGNKKALAIFLFYSDIFN